MSPKISVQHITDQKGIQLIESFFLEKGWIVRRQEKDYGIDLEIEIVNQVGVVTGKLLKIQVKSHSIINFKNNIFTEYISIEHAEYWENIDIPVFLFVVDTTNKKIYWENAIIGLRRSFKKHLKSIPYRIREDLDLAIGSSFDEFIYSIEGFKQVKNYKSIVTFIIEKFDYFLMLYERLHCCDSFLSIDTEYSEALKIHFGYVFDFPSYYLSKKYNSTYCEFKELSSKVDISLIEFQEAIPICDMVFNYYYEIIATIHLNMLELECEYWINKDKKFLEEVKKIKVPISNKEEDVLNFFVKHYVENDKIFNPIYI